MAATRKVDRALDLGAGTGALSRLLQWRATWVAAVEPDPRMWAVLARRLRQGLVGLAGTYSRVLALPAEQRERAMGATRRAVAGLADNPHAPVALPTRCRCLRAVRQ